MYEFDVLFINVFQGHHSSICKMTVLHINIFLRAKNGGQGASFTALSLSNDHSIQAMARKEGIPVDTLDFACRVVNREDVDYNYLKQFSDNPAILVKQLSFPPTLEKNVTGVSWVFIVLHFFL